MIQTIKVRILYQKHIGICLLILLAATSGLRGQTPSIIPQPVEMTIDKGIFTLDNQTGLVFDATSKELRQLAAFMNQYLAQITGDSLICNGNAKKTIKLINSDIPGIGEEGYLMDIDSNSIIIKANSRKGIFYGMQTLFQMLPAIRTNEVIQMSAIHVRDYPRFRWRGMHLDVCRHFFSPALVKQYINLLAAYKFNTFHWHLVDDQGWRIEIKQYPLLTQVGAWRVDKNYINWRDRPQAKPGEPANYGGYYTQEQIKDIIAYAVERNITIVPEIEMPAHVASAIAAYPWLSCTQNPQLTMTGGDYTGMASGYCAGNDSVFTFLENVLTEVIDLFPSEYIHIGGDELDKSPWKVCPKCQARMKAEGLKDVDELQSYFIRRIEKFVNSKGRKIIGWDEILEGGLAPEATVMSWRGEAGGITAAQMGHDVVMTPGTPLYFDHYQADPATEPLAIGGFNTLKMVYDYDPVPAVLTPEQSKHILGAQANIWAEFITSPLHVLYMMMPRMMALSEVDWSPKEKKDWGDFNERLQYHLKRLDQLGIPYCKGNMRVDIQPITQDNQLYARLSTEAYKGQIYYTTDGSNPTQYSKLYVDPIPVKSSQTIRAVTVIDGEVMSKQAAEQSFVIHKAVGLPVTYTYPNSPYYKAEGPNVLTDGIRGTSDYGKKWHAFSSKDLIATIDLGKMTEIHSLSLGCLQHYRAWILMPADVTFEVSADGKKFTEVQTVKNRISPEEKEPVISDFTAEFPPRKARYVRVTARAQEHLPAGHPGAGKRPWIFADELIVE